MGVILDYDSEGHIISAGDMLQNVIGPLQNQWSQPNSSCGPNLPCHFYFGGVMAWNYADDVNDRNGEWGSTIGSHFGLTSTPQNWSSEVPLAGQQIGIDGNATYPFAVQVPNTNVLQVFTRARTTTCTLFGGIRIRVGTSLYECPGRTM
jgi:hypothetical protein